MGKSDVFAGKNKDKIKKKIISVILVAAKVHRMTRYKDMHGLLEAQVLRIL